MLTLLLLACKLQQLPPPTEAPLAACPPDLIGQFSLASYPGMDDVGPNGERPMPMSKDYTFTADTFTMEGYPPLTITGRYTVLTAENTRLQVKFTDTLFEGEPSADRTVWVTLSECGQAMEMDQMTYRRAAQAP
ncbi:MAG: hypothetical protein ACI8S6_005674 [Myxococcota bacterium]|jgi:hypothetical protein